jgi:predicted RNA binding protein YcfA (HicA-like mRNA interferase family)
VKPIKYRALAKLLRSLGCDLIRTRGSHEVWRTPQGCTTTIPNDTTVAPGTLRSIRNNLTPCLGEGWLGNLEK